MAFRLFIIQILLLFQLHSYSFNTTQFAKARDSKGNEIKNGAGVLQPRDYIEIECPITGAKWTKAPSIQPNSKHVDIKFDDRIKTNGNKLVIRSLQFEDSGSYRCEKDSKGFPFILIVYEISSTSNGESALIKYVEEVNGITYANYRIDRQHSSNISCSCSSGMDLNKVTITWMRSNRPLQISDNFNITTEIDPQRKQVTSTLVMLKSETKPEYYGEYVCSCSVVAKQSNSKVVRFFSRPIFHELMTSKRTSEGEQVEIECGAWGYPTLTNGSVEWRFQNSSQLREGITVQQNPNDAGKSVLVIPSVKQSDRGLYSCHATNTQGTNVMAIMIRVKGKYAAIWPLIGIVVQLIILAVIIIVYELRKKKTHLPGETIDETRRPLDDNNRLEYDVNTGERMDQTDVRQRLVKT